MAMVYNDGDGATGNDNDVVDGNGATGDSDVDDGDSAMGVNNGNCMT